MCVCVCICMCVFMYAYNHIHISTVSLLFIYMQKKLINTYKRNIILLFAQNMVNTFHNMIFDSNKCYLCFNLKR